MNWKKRQMREPSRTSGQPQAARKAGPVIRIATAIKAQKWLMTRLLAEATGNEKAILKANAASALDVEESVADQRQIEVRLRISEREAELTVSDDGEGFRIGGNRAMPRGLGLLSLEERAKLLEGNFRLDAAPGKGVRICLTIPLQH